MEKKIIVAEDSLTIQKVFELTFLRTGYQVTYVDKGEELVALAKELNPSLVICDLTLPDMDGYETIRRLKEDPSTSKIPVLLMAGSLEPVDEEKFRACGADGLLQKPFESQELLDKVEELIAEVGGVETVASKEEASPEGWDFADVFEEVEMGVESESVSAPGMLDEMVVGESEVSRLNAEEFAVGVDEVGETGQVEVGFEEAPSELGEEEDLAALDELLDEVPDDELEEIEDLFDEEAEEHLVSPGEAAEESVLDVIEPGDPGQQELEVVEDREPETPAEETLQDRAEGDFIMDEGVRHVEDFPVSSGYDLESPKVVRETFARVDSESIKEDLSQAIEAALSSTGLVEELREEIKEILEKVLWEVIPSVMEDLRSEIIKVIRDVSKEVIPEIAERIISEEIEKIREEITSGD